jgi:tRNA pseudouridine55 synthase
VDRGGIVLIDKEAGRTSFETVQRVRKALRAAKAGHAGTLDKAASGLLIVCIDGATAVQQILMGGLKRYRAVVRLGVETDTLDRYGKVVNTLPAGVHSDGEIETVFSRYIGKTLQVPPRFSSIHVKGKRSYLRTLQGEDFTLEPREIEVSELKLLGKGEDFLDIEVLVSKGTYVRSLARDIARDLGTCGSLMELRRLSIGPFSVDGALKAEDLAPAIEEQGVREPQVMEPQVQRPKVSIIPLSEALEHLPKISVDQENARRIAHGIPLEKVLPDDALDALGEGYTRILFGDDLIALVHGKKRPTYFKVFG